MAQNSLQEKIEQLKNAQKVRQMTPEQIKLAQETYARTQPLYWQWSIREQTPAEKRKARWTRAWDAAKWALSSLYGAATFIPETLWRIGTAWVDQIAGTDYQSKLDDVANYVPTKLRNSASNSKVFDKWQEYTDDALMAAALLTAWATWPKSPRARLQDLNRNPLKYSWTEATNIVRNAIDAGVDWIKSWKVKLTPEQVASKVSLNKIWEMKWLDASNYDWMSDTWNRPAYQQKLFSQYNNAKNGGNMSTFRDIPLSEVKKLWYEYGYYDSPILSEWDYQPLWRPLTKSEIAEMKNYSKEWNDILKSYENYISAEDAEMLANDNAILEEIAKSKWSKSNTSRARAKATKKRNMSAKERAARERAEDSANELAADRLRNEAWNMSLEDMYRYWKSQQNW